MIFGPFKIICLGPVMVQIIQEVRIEEGNEIAAIIHQLGKDGCSFLMFVCYLAVVDKLTYNSKIYLLPHEYCGESKGLIHNSNI